VTSKIEYNKLLDVTSEAYHSSQGLSSTKLKPILTTPLDYQNSLTQNKDSEAMAFGRLVHTICLEPEKFKSEVAIAPELNRRTKQGKEDWAKFEAKNQGKTIIKKETWEQLASLAKAFNENPFIAANKSKFIVEKSVYTEIDGLILKARPDKLSFSEGKNVYNPSLSPVFNLDKCDHLVID